MDRKAETGTAEQASHMTLDTSYVRDYILSAGNHLTLPLLEAWLDVHGRPDTVAVPLPPGVTDPREAAKAFVSAMFAGLVGEYGTKSRQVSDQAHGCLLAGVFSKERALWGEKEITVREISSQNGLRTWEVTCSSGMTFRYAAKDGYVLRVSERSLDKKL